MPITDNRPSAGSGGGGAVDTVNGQTGDVVITAASIGATPQPASQGTPASPLLLDDTTPVTLSTTVSETLHVAGDGAPFDIDLANFSGVKPIGANLKIVVYGAFALTFVEGGNFTMNGDRVCVAGSILNFYSDGVGYIEDAGNEIA